MAISLGIHPIFSTDKPKWLYWIEVEKLCLTIAQVFVAESDLCWHMLVLQYLHLLQTIFVLHKYHKYQQITQETVDNHTLWITFPGLIRKPSFKHAEKTYITSWAWNLAEVPAQICVDTLGGVRGRRISELCHGFDAVLYGTCGSYCMDYAWFYFTKNLRMICRFFLHFPQSLGRYPRIFRSIFPAFA